MSEEQEKEYQDILKLSKDIKWYSQRFVIHPDQLMSLTLPASLEWKSRKFNEENKEEIPKDKGVYAFVLQHNDNNLPSHGYITYIGITGKKSKARNLNIRYREYLRDQKIPKRPSIHEMLVKWKDCIQFYYASLKDTDLDLSEVEKKLNDAIIPPYSTNDFTATVRTAKGMFEKS